MYLKGGDSLQKIADRYGMSRQNVQKILDAFGVLKMDRVPTKRNRSLADLRAISTLHVRIGHHISYARHFTLKMSVDEFAMKVRLTRQRLRKIEVGVEDPTLGELVRIADALNEPFMTMFTTPNMAKAA